MNATMNNENKGIHKLLKLSDKSISIKVIFWKNVIVYK